MNYKSIILGRIRSIVFLFLFLISYPAKSQTIDSLKIDSIPGQKDIVDIFIRNTKWYKTKHPEPGKKKFYFSLMPLSGGSSDQGVTISSINTSFQLGNPESTNLSNITFYPTTNFDTRYQFKVLPYLWLNNNNWNIPGNMEIAYMKHKTYGLGANSPKDSLQIINYNYLKVYFSVNHKIASGFFVGIGYNLDNFYNIEKDSTHSNAETFNSYDFGTDYKSLSSGITFNFLYDNRKNSINPLEGFYSNLQMRINSSSFGSDYSWNSIYFDMRKYFSFSNKKHSTLAFWGIYWATWGEVPYLNLPGTALDYSGWTGRGYWKGRYRGKQMLYAETEYRFDLTNNGLWGGVVFMNAQSYTEPATSKFEYIKPAAGIGCRLKFNKYSDSNITFDIAVGKESFNWYFSLNEAF